MSDIARDRDKALSAIGHAISTRPATWSPEELLDAVVDSGAVVWATDHQGAVEDAEREQARYYAMRDDRDRLQALVDAHKGFLRDALNRLGGQ